MTPKRNRTIPAKPTKGSDPRIFLPEPLRGEDGPGPEQTESDEGEEVHDVGARDRALPERREMRGERQRAQDVPGDSFGAVRGPVRDEQHEKDDERADGGDDLV